MGLESGKRRIGSSSSQTPGASTLTEVNTLLSISAHKIHVKCEIRFRQKSFKQLIQQLFKLLRMYTGDATINRAYMVLAFVGLIIKWSLLLLQLILKIEIFTNCSGEGVKQSIILLSILLWTECLCFLKIHILKL